MSNTDHDDSGWDNLAEDLGIVADKSEKTPKQPDRPEALPMKPKPKNAMHLAFEKVNAAAEEDDFGDGLPNEPTGVAALYDPGPDAVADEEDEDAPEVGDSAGTGDEPGKKKRRRRRRGKKKGPETAALGAEGEEDEEEVSNVEEGEAPAEVEDDEDEEGGSPTAMDEEMEAEVAMPRQEWNVMTWNDLVSKLYRPN